MRRAGIRYAVAAALAALGCSVEAEAPAWGTHVDDWRDHVVYQIVVDRFDNGDPGNDDGVVPGDLARWQGGDWRGVTRRLDYLEELGVTAIWISPVVANVPRLPDADGYHGYWAADFTEVERRFGSLEELQELVAEAHRRDMAVIVDVVINHTGRVFFYDFDGDGEPDDGELEPRYAGDDAYAELAWLSPAPRVFHGAGARELELDDFHRRGQITDYASAEQRELGDFPDGLRDLDTERPETMDALVDTWVRWVELTDVDGFRLDAAPHVPHAAWRAFAERLRDRLAARGKDRFLLVGEVWNADPQVLAGYTAEGGLDSVFDFSFKRAVIDGVILDGAAPATAVAALTDHRALYPDAPHAGGVALAPWQARLSFADNHDMRRVRGWLNDPYAVELALTAVLTVDAIPCIYYGTEQGFAGAGGHGSREVMWTTDFRTDGRIARHLMALTAARRASPALRRGDLRVRYADANGPGVLAWERAADGDRALVALNSDPTRARTAAIETGWPAGTVVRDQLRDSAPITVGAGGVVEVAVPPRAAIILR